ncbi:hypothetical protein V8E53_002953 [Lactarius tabidus]
MLTLCCSTLSEFTTIEDPAFALKHHHFAPQLDFVFTHVIIRNIKSPHQNDPNTVAQVFENLLGHSHLLPSQMQVNELMEEWSLEPVRAILAPTERTNFAMEPIFICSGSGSKVKTRKQVFTRASYNFTGLVDKEANSVRIETPGKYGGGRCRLPGLMVINAYMDLELDISDPFGAESSIFGFSNTHGFNYRDINTLANFLLGVEKEHCKHGGPLMRRFISTMDTIEKDSTGVYLLTKLRRQWPQVNGWILQGLAHTAFVESGSFSLPLARHCS